jgi:hypothetical protein
VAIALVSYERFVKDEASDDATAASLGKAESTQNVAKGARTDIFDAASTVKPSGSEVKEAASAPPVYRNRSLPTGTRLKRDSSTSGHGVLQIDNYSGADAVVTVILSNTEKPVRIVFIKAGDMFKLESLSSGAYRVRFAMGTDWDESARSFTTSAGYYEFGRILFFEETRKSNGIEYSVHEITLNTDVTGNVPRVEISREKFLAGLSNSSQ